MSDPLQQSAAPDSRTARPDGAWDAPVDPLALLARPDKWFVSGGRALAYAPPFPLFLDSPGFWDTAHYLHFPVTPGFSYALLDEDGRVVPLSAGTRDWRPDRTSLRFIAPGLHVREDRVIPGLDALVSRVTVRNTAAVPRRLQVIAWTSQSLDDQPLPQSGEAGSATFDRTAQSGTAVHLDGPAQSVTRPVGAPRGQSLPMTTALALSGARSRLAVVAEPAASRPALFLTPFIELIGPDGLAPQGPLPDLNAGGTAHLAVERPLTLAPGEVASFTVALGVGSREDAARNAAVEAAALADPA
ncbi:MAG TPA: hypothetical protein VHN99_11380, partial [Deinococcales bacterium]|nr:hypothetical protein [Deinococcales bacterium]